MVGQPGDNEGVPFHQRRLACLPIVIIGVVLAVALSSWMGGREQSMLASKFSGRAKDRVLAIERAFQNALLCVDSLAAFIQATPDLDRRRFGSFARQLLARDTSLQALGFDRIVPDADRTRHELDTRREGFDGYEIGERNDDGEVVRAGDRPEYVVVHYLEPLEGNERALGFDIASETVRRAALDRTRETGQMSATGVLRLVQEKGDQAGILVCAPVHDPAEPGTDLTGFAVGAFRVGAIVDGVLGGFERSDVQVQMSDLDPFGGGPLYGGPGGGVDATAELADMRVEHEIDVAGRNWRIVCTPAESFLAAERMWGAPLTFWLILLLTGGVTAYVYRFARVNQRLGHWIVEHERARAELATTHHWMQLALEAFDGGVWDLDLQAGRIHLSPGLDSLTGTGVGESPCRLSTWLERIHPDDRERVQITWQGRHEGDPQPTSTEYRLQGARGGWLWVLERSRSIEFDTDGRPLRIVGTTLDITPRKATEEAMLQLNLAVEEAMTGISRVDVTERYTMVRKIYAQMLGYEAEEMLGMPWQATVHPRDLDKCRAAFRTMIATGRGEATATARRKDGSTFVKHIQLVQIKDATGTHTGHYCFMRDVTEQAVAEAALRLRDRAIRSVGNGIVIIDASRPDHPIVFVNEAFERITGRSAADVIGQNCRLLIGDDESQPGRSELLDAITSHREARVVFRNHREDGTAFWNEIFITPVLDTDGQLTHFVAVQTDVTARMQAEEENARAESERRQSQKLEAVGTLASGIAHDFNNLLTAIEGHATQAGEQLDARHPASRSLELVRQACDQAASVTRSLLTFSNRSESEKAPVDLVAIARHSMSLMESLLPASIEIRQHYPEDEVRVDGDRHQLQQVLINLAINARDAMPGGGTLTIGIDVSGTSGASSSSTPQAVVTVSDTGQGMPAETAARALEPFFTTKERSKGTGLGLSVVHGIVTDHGGKIELQSEPERGTTVVVKLPLCESGSPPAARPTTAAPTRQRPGSGQQILVAEDNELVRPLIVGTLQRIGYDVLVAEDGEQVLEQFARHQDTIDLVVLDLDLPKKSGLECMREIRADRPGIAVLIVTGNCAQPIENGDDSQPRLLEKPFQMRELQAAVEDLLAAGRVD